MEEVMRVEDFIGYNSFLVGDGRVVAIVSCRLRWWVPLSRTCQPLATAIMQMVYSNNNIIIILNNVIN